MAKKMTGKGNLTREILEKATQVSGSPRWGGYYTKKTIQTDAKKKNESSRIGLWSFGLGKTSEGKNGIKC